MIHGPSNVNFMKIAVVFNVMPFRTVDSEKLGFFFFMLKESYIPEDSFLEIIFIFMKFLYSCIRILPIVYVHWSINVYIEIWIHKSFYVFKRNKLVS